MPYSDTVARKAYQAAYFKANREKLMAKRMDRYWANLNTQRAYAKRYYRTHRATCIERSIRHKNENRDFYADWSRRRVEALSDGYVKSLISAGTRLSAKSLPRSLVEAKKAHLKLIRQIKENEKCNPATKRAMRRVC